MEHSQELTTYWSTKLTSTNLSIQKLFEVYSPNHNGKKLEIKLRKQNEKKKKKKTDYMETKYSFSMGQ